MNQKEIVDSVFRMAGSGELLLYLKELASKDARIASEMECRFLSEREWDYKSEIDEAFDEIIEHRFYDETMHDWSAVTRNCKAILSKAKAYMNAQRYNKASDVGLYMLETLIEVYDYSEIDEFPYDEDYMIARGDGIDYDPGCVGFVKDAAEFVVKALSAGKSSESFAVEEFNDIMARFKSVAVGISSDRCIDGYLDALSVYNEYAKTFQSRETYLEEQISILEEEGGEETASEIYKLLSSAPVGNWTLDKFAWKYIGFSTVAEAFVGRLEAEGRIEEAISAIEKHFGQKYPESDYNPLSEKWFQLVWETADVEKKRDIAVFYFIHRRDKIRYYHALKSISSEDEWTSILSELLKCADGSLFNDEWKYQIYQEEGRNSELMTLITSPERSIFVCTHGAILLDQISHFSRYGNIFTDKERSSLVNEFTARLYHESSGYDSKTYPDLVSSIRILSRISPEAEVKMNDFINWLRLQYPRRRKMLELLK